MRGATLLSLFKGPVTPRGLDRLFDRAGLGVESCEDVICDVLSSPVVRDISQGICDGGCVMTPPCKSREKAGIRDLWRQGFDDTLSEVGEDGYLVCPAL